MVSGALQRSELGSLLFEMYLNDMDTNVGGLKSKFVDKKKLGGVLAREEDGQRIQQDINLLEI